MNKTRPEHNFLLKSVLTKKSSRIISTVKAPTNPKPLQHQRGDVDNQWAPAAGGGTHTVTVPHLCKD